MMWRGGKVSSKWFGINLAEIRANGESGPAKKAKNIGNRGESP